MDVKQLHKHDGTKWDCLVPQLHKHDGTKWDCLVHKWLIDNIKNTMGQSETLVHQLFLDNITNTMWQRETVWYLKGGQISL